jgi:nucleoid-associated protein YgaU
MFRESGQPIRAVCTIELTETPPGGKKQNPTSGSRGAQAIVQLVDGDSLAAIAYREYGDATKWRAIAEANSIDDPLRIRPGTKLLVPSKTEVSR